MAILTGTGDTSFCAGADLGRDNPVAMRTAKEIAVRSLSLETPFALESCLSARVFATEDAKEGPKAFMEKRRPQFIGR